MKSLLIIPLVFSLKTFANLDLLLKDSENTKVSSLDQKHNELKLDDVFLVQFYSKWKSAINLPFELNSWANMIIAHDFEKASHLISVVKEKSPENFKQVVNATELYLYWKIGLHHTFVNNWINTSEKTNFLNTDLAIAIDQLVGVDNFNWLIEKGIFLGEDQKIKISKLDSEYSKLLFNLKGLALLRKGEEAFNILNNVTNETIKFQLAQSIVLSFAKKGMLSDAAKLLKNIIEPQISKSKSIDDYSSYYILLARLLYQAGALDAASKYYTMIPEKSELFLSARVENLWIYLRQNNVSKLKGELASLDLSLFDEKFLPEVYLVSSISQLKLCQFQDVKFSFDKFIEKNKVWIQRINENINNNQISLINSNDFYVKFGKKSEKSNIVETELIKNLAAKSIEAVVPAIGIQKHWEKSLDYLSSQEVLLSKKQTAEIKRGWINRKRILDNNIRKMRFVKIEFISMMKRYSYQLAKKFDSVSTYSAAPKRANQIEFPFDGLVWGDEPFHMSAEVKSLCLRGK